jgi:hypothetical protein
MLSDIRFLVFSSHIDLVLSRQFGLCDEEAGVLELDSLAFGNDRRLTLCILTCAKLPLPPKTTRNHEHNRMFVDARSMSVVGNGEKL